MKSIQKFLDSMNVSMSISAYETPAKEPTFKDYDPNDKIDPLEDFLKKEDNKEDD